MLISQWIIQTDYCLQIIEWTTDTQLKYHDNGYTSFLVDYKYQYPIETCLTKLSSDGPDHGLVTSDGQDTVVKSGEISSRYLIE